MSATVADLQPKTLENAKRQFVELYGSALVMNTYLKIALVLVSLIALGLLLALFMSPIIVPYIVTAIAVYFLSARLGFVGSPLALLLHRGLEARLKICRT